MKSKAWILLLVLAALGGCQSVQTTEGGTVGIDRRQSMSSLVSSAQMDKSAADAYSKVLSTRARRTSSTRIPRRSRACAPSPTG